jgi:hypothetical protein
MIRVRPIESADRPWVVRRLGDAFGGVGVARKGVLVDASVLPGFVATDGGRAVGLLTYDVAHGENARWWRYSARSRVWGSAGP